MGDASTSQEESGIFQGFADPWGSGGDADAGGHTAVEPQAVAGGSPKAVAAAAASMVCGQLSAQDREALENRIRSTEALVLQRWTKARELDDEILAFSSMITCMPLPASCKAAQLPRGYSATWGLEVRREAGRWRVIAAGCGFRPGEAVERCALMPLRRPEDDDDAICRFMSLWDPDAEWTKQHGEKLPEVRAQKLEEMQLHRSEVLHHHRIVRLGSCSYYPLGYAHLYADATGMAPDGAPPAAAELRLEAAAEWPARGGVFVAAGAAYGPGRVVELSPAVVLDGPAAVHCADYAMAFGGNCGTCSVLPLGCGALYNHSSKDAVKTCTPLAWAYDEELDLVAFRADMLLQTAASSSSTMGTDIGAAAAWSRRCCDFASRCL
eukprot:CAMPEP_0179115526 /NCGR_PEP_ID=MMETSP0796-20121207/54145_1 /TAXON_ID=73915 /ORGANISM="Pyrodinium bahamense, Strain pbaha01" /LENGTH=380 /DNA_ID=CAMNT_0020813779 /DNA_START=16 /DNA_END=1156 /DNA_ORIENTATION=+